MNVEQCPSEIQCDLRLSGWYCVGDIVEAADDAKRACRPCNADTDLNTNNCAEFMRDEIE